MPAQRLLPRLSVASLLLAGLTHVAPAQTAPPERRWNVIERQLAAPAPCVNFHEAPLAQVLTEICDATGVHLAFDKPALEEEGVSLDSPVSITLEDTPLKEALHLVLRDFGLTCVVKDDVLTVTTPAHGRGKLATMTYQVADLVIPVGNLGEVQETRACAPRATPATEEDKLIGLIQSAVHPKTWAPAGGVGTVEYFPLTMALVVCQTPDVQEEVADLLAALRRMQDQQVAFEVRFLSVSDDLLESVCTGLGLEKTRLDPAPNCGDAAQPTWAAFLSDAQARKILEQVQGDARANVMQAPKLTVLNGQRAAVNVTDIRTFVTGYQPATRDGKVVIVPHTEEVPLGVKLAVEPAISADRCFVRLKVAATLTSLVSEQVPLFPVAMPVRPAAGSPENAQPVVFTQFIQQPQVNRAAIDTTVAIPDGGTVLLGGIKRLTEKGHEDGPPVLSKIPYINRLFRNVGYGREVENVVVMVTPRILVQEEEEIRQADSPRVSPCKDKPQATALCPAACAGSKLGELLRQYHEACAAGHADEARKLAIECLAIDPACFHAP